MRVVDTRGEHLDGVPLVSFPEGREPAENFVVKATTDARGEAVFGRLPWGNSTWVGIALPLGEAVSAPAREGAVVELVVPPLGVLDFDVVDAQGGPMGEGGAYLGVDFDVGEGGAHLALWAPAFPCRLRVPLGLEYGFQLAWPEWRPVSEDGWPALNAAAPGRSHRVVVRARYPVLVGRLVAPGGAPFVGQARVAWGTEWGTRGGTGRDRRELGLPCDDGGAFRTPVHSWVRPGVPRTARFLASSGSGFLDLECVVDLSRALPAADTPLGDLLLSERPVLVAGRVRGQAEGALGRGALHVYERASPNEPWSAPPFDAQLQQDGTFLVVGQSRPGSGYRVHVEARDLRQVSAGSFEPGTRDFVIEVARPAALHTTLSLDHNLVPSEFALRFDYGDSPALAPDPAPARKFRRELDDLQPGIADVVLQHVSGTELARREAVELRSGQTAELEFDLRGQLNAFRISLEYSTRDPGRDLRVLFREGEDGAYGLLAHGGLARRAIVTTASRVDAVVLARGYVAVWLDDLDTDVTVQLQPGPTVSVEDPDGACRDDPVHSLQAVFHPQEPRLAAVTPAGSLRAYPRSDGFATPLPSSGRYRVEWLAGIRDEGEFALDVAPLEVQVRDGHQRLDLRLPLDEWRRFKEARAR